jgi:preprotein translocase subunit SecD
VHARVRGPAATVTFSAGQHASRAALQRDARIIGQRASHLCIPVRVGVASSSTISLTGPRADQARLRALGVAGDLDFRQVLLTGPAAASVAHSAGRPAAVSAAVRARYDRLNCSKPGWQEQLLRLQGADLPAGAQIVSCTRNGTVKYALGAVRVAGGDIRNASAFISTAGSGWQVQIIFDRSGKAALGRFTSALYRRYHGSQGNPRNQLAIVEDGITISAPSVEAPITTGMAVIPGMPGQPPAQQAAASQLAADLMSGALPVALTVQSVRARAAAG